LFFVVSGEGKYRFGETIVPVRSGDIVAAPAGTQAHQLINTGSDDLRYLGISTAGGVDVVDYPDSKKIAVAAGVKNALQDCNLCRPGPPCAGRLLRRRKRLSRETCLYVRHATSSAFKRIKVGKVAKSRRHSREPHDLSAAWAKRGPWRVFVRAFVTHGQSGP
jgi:hypothetical protein